MYEITVGSKEITVKVTAFTKEEALKFFEEEAVLWLKGIKTAHETVPIKTEVVVDESGKKELVSAPVPQVAPQVMLKPCPNCGEQNALMEKISRSDANPGKHFLMCTKCKKAVYPPEMGWKKKSW